MFGDVGLYPELAPHEGEEEAEEAPTLGGPVVRHAHLQVNLMNLGNVSLSTTGFYG